MAIVDAEDEQTLQKLHEIILNITRGQAEQQGQPQKVASKEYGGVTVWTFNGKEAHAILGKRLIFANGPRVSRRFWTCRPVRRQGLATRPDLQPAQKAGNPPGQPPPCS